MEKNIVKSKKLREEIYSTQLNNGLKIVILPKKSYTKKFAIFATKYGSNDNEFIPIGDNESIEVPEGIAHFLEHKLFEEPDGNIFNEFSKLGSQVNAFTNFNHTAYLFSCTDEFYKNLELLVKFVQHPYFTDENVNKEKGIIEQEIRMYDDSPNWKVFFNTLRGMYHRHPVRIDIAGTVESINEIDKEVLYKCYNTFYHPENMVLFMIGDIDFDKSVQVIKENQRSDIEKFSGEIKRIYADEPKEINKRIIEEELSVSTPLFNIGFKDLDTGYDGDKLLFKQITTNILLDMLFGESSQFYQKLYEKGLIDSSFGTQYIGYKDYGHSILGGESENPKEILEEVLDYIKELKEKGLPKESFERIKRKYTGHHIMNFNSIEYVATEFVKFYFENSSLFRYLDIIEELKFEDAEKRFKEHFTDNNYVLSIVNPS